MKRKLIIRVIIVILLILICVGGYLYISNNKKIDIGFKVKNNYVIENINLEDNYNFYLECYNWYKKIENDTGVYILNTTYFSNEVINVWQENNTYTNIPKKPFWYYTVSPSYLTTMNINVDNKIIEDAKNGVRVFLIPDSYTEEEKNMIANHLVEDSERALSENAPRKPKDAIRTKYYEKNEIEFDTYTPTQEYFTYPNEQNLPLTEKAPIIFICTSNNMTYFESESLCATDVNSYIKFENEDILKKYVAEDFLTRYNITFNKLSKIYKKAQKFGLTDKGMFRVFEN